MFAIWTAENHILECTELFQAFGTPRQNRVPELRPSRWTSSSRALPASVLELAEGLPVKGSTDHRIAYYHCGANKSPGSDRTQAGQLWRRHGQVDPSQVGRNRNDSNRWDSTRGGEPFSCRHSRNTLRVPTDLHGRCGRLPPLQSASINGLPRLGSAAVTDDGS